MAALYAEFLYESAQIQRRRFAFLPWHEYSGLNGSSKVQCSPNGIVSKGKSQIVPRAKRVLMCWEFGGGNSRARHLKVIGERLHGMGFVITYALRRADAGLAVGIPAEAIRIAPNRPLRPWPVEEMASATYGEVLGQIMLGPRGDLPERLQKWQALVEAEQPDLIIANCAPSLSLLYYGQIPIVAIGNGYDLPPTSLSSFPRLIEDVPLRYEERAAVEQLNAALHAYDKKPLSQFPQINRADRTYLLTLPCIDPYREHRDGEWLGSPDTKDIVLRRKSQWMFACFQENQQTDIRLIEGLIRSRLPGKAIFLTPLRRTMKLLEAADISTPDGLAYLPFELLSCGVIVHPGSSGMAMAGIAAGIPQVTIHTNLEERLVSRAIEARNAGTMLNWDTFRVSDLAIAIRKTLESAGMQKAARNLSLENTRYLQRDPVSEIAGGVASMLDG